MKQKVTHIIIEHLVQEDIAFVFGITGKAISPLIDAILDYDEIRYVSAKHESGAALMAYGYAQGSGKIGVCCGTTGGGSTNLATGVATAFMNSIPMLVFTGQISTAEFGKGGFQESTGFGQTINTVDFFKPITKESLMLINPVNTAEIIRYAIKSAISGRKGPVHINIPFDIQLSQTEYEKHERISQTISCDLNFQSSALNSATALIREAKYPVFLVGWGANLSGANNEIVEIAEKLNIPIATTLQGKGTIHSKHPLYIGIMGSCGHSSAIEYIFERADLLIAVGTSFNEFTTINWNKGFLNNKKIIQIDIDSREIGKNYPVQLGLVGDAKVIMYQLKLLINRVNNIAPKDFNQHQPNIELLFEKPDHAIEIKIRNKEICINTETLKENSIIIRPEAQLADNSAYSGGMKIIVKNDFSYAFFDAEKMNDESIPIKPQRLMREIRENTPDDTIFLADSGSHWAWAMHYLPVYPGGNFFPTLSLGSMGASICSSMGVKIAKPKNPVVCICGDGSFIMNGNEIVTAEQYNLPVIWIILNDSRYSMPAVSSKIIYNRTIGVDFNKIYFSKVAEAFNIKGYTVEKPGELPKILSEAISSNKPAVIDVFIDSTEIPPVGNRLK